MQGVAAVAHLVAIIHESGRQTFDAVNVAGTRNVVDAAKATGVRRFLHMSALGAVDDSELRYVYSKWLGEEAVRKSGLEYTIFRPSVIFGEGFGFIDRIVQSVNMTRPVVPVPGSGKNRFQPMWSGDVAECFARALNDPATAGKTYEIGGPEHLTYEQVLDMVMAKLGAKRVKIHVPLFAMRPVAILMDAFLKDPPVTPVQLKQLKLDNTTALDSVERSFGFKPKSLADGLDYIAPKKRTRDAAASQVTR